MIGDALTISYNGPAKIYADGKLVGETDRCSIRATYEQLSPASLLGAIEQQISEERRPVVMAFLMQEGAIAWLKDLLPGREPATNPAVPEFLSAWGVPVFPDCRVPTDKCWAVFSDGHIEEIDLGESEG